MSMNSTIKLQTVSSLFWKLFERFGRSVVELAVQIVLARLIAPEQFGALAIMLVFISIGNVIVVSGLNTALVQASDITDADCSTVFWFSLAVSALLYAAIFLLAPVIASFYDLDDIVWPLRTLALLLLVNAYNAVQVAIVQRALEFKKVFVATSVAAILSGAVGIMAAVFGMGLWALVAQQLFYQLSNCVVLAFRVTWKPRLVFDFARARKLLGFGWKLLISGLLDVGYQSLSDLIVGKQFSSLQLGYVSQGKRYPQALGSMLDGAIQPVMLSAVSRVQDDLSSVKRLVRRALKTSCYLIMPCMTCFALVAEPLVRFLLGEQWLPSVYFLQIYCFTQALLPIHSSNLQALNAMGRSDLFLKLEVVKKTYGLVFLLVTAFVFRDVHLMIGSYLIAGVISTFVNACPNKRIINYSYLEQLRDIAPGILATFAAAAIAWPLSLVMMPSVVLILLQVIVMFFSYLTISKLFHIEALDYLLKTAHEMFEKKKAGFAGEETVDDRH